MGFKPLFCKEEASIRCADGLLGEILRGVCDSHGKWHARKVLRNARCALMVATFAAVSAVASTGHFVSIPELEVLAILLAALLHDLDDRKLFPDHKNYENARRVMKKVCESRGDPDDKAGLGDRVISMISYVSTSGNGDEVPEEFKDHPWVLIPRWADRLEAVGRKVGIPRCAQYTKGIRRPLFTERTKRARTEEELWKIATPERYRLYTQGGIDEEGKERKKGESESMIDHFYDKLLHIGRVTTGNAFLDSEFAKRHTEMVQFVLKFGRTGKVEEGDIDFKEDFLTINPFSGEWIRCLFRERIYFGNFFGFIKSLEMDTALICLSVIFLLIQGLKMTLIGCVVGMVAFLFTTMVTRGFPFTKTVAAYLLLSLTILTPFINGFLLRGVPVPDVLSILDNYTTVLVLTLILFKAEDGIIALASVGGAAVWLLIFILTGPDTVLSTLIFNVVTNALCGCYAFALGAKKNEVNTKGFWIKVCSFSLHIGCSTGITYLYDNEFRDQLRDSLNIIKALGLTNPSTVPDSTRKVD